MSGAASPNPHGEGRFSPEHYEFVDWFDNRPEALQAAILGGAPPEAVNEMVAAVQGQRRRLRDQGSSVYGPVGRCAHCGTSIRYHVVYRDRRDGSLVAVGETCAEERLDRSPREWQARKRELDDMRERARSGEQRIKLRNEFPEAVALLEQCMKEFAERQEALERRYEENVAHEEAGCRGRGNSDLFRAWNERWPAFVLDIAMKLSRRPKLTERQATAALEATARLRERVAARAAEAATAEPVPQRAERMAVEGEVLTVRVQEGHYGTTVKMLVRADAGWKVWGTAPNILLCARDDDDREIELRGQRVRFMAAVEPSRDDPTFGFFSRPTQAELVNGAGS